MKMSVLCLFSRPFPIAVCSLSLNHHLAWTNTLGRNATQYNMLFTLMHILPYHLFRIHVPQIFVKSPFYAHTCAMAFYLVVSAPLPYAWIWYGRCSYVERSHRVEMCTHFTCDDSLDSSLFVYLLFCFAPISYEFFSASVFYLYFMHFDTNLLFYFDNCFMYRCRFGFLLWIRMGWDAICDADNIRFKGEYFWT